MSLYTIAYQSTERLRFHDQDLLGLLSGARSNNMRLNITGMLLYHEGSFFQIIEGPKEAVCTLYDGIQGDARHTNVVTQYENALDERLFPHWSMLFRTVDGLTVRSVESMADMIALDIPMHGSDSFASHKTEILSLINKVTMSLVA